MNLASLVRACNFIFLFLQSSFICFSKVKLLSAVIPRKFSLQLPSITELLILGVWVIRPPAPQKFKTSSTSSYLKSSLYDRVLWAYGLFKPCWLLTHATSTCFKEKALLLTMHLGCFVNFILCWTDKYMFKGNKLNWKIHVRS